MRARWRTRWDVGREVWRASNCGAKASPSLLATLRPPRCLNAEPSGIYPQQRRVMVIFLRRPYIPVDLLTTATRAGSPCFLSSSSLYRFFLILTLIIISKRPESPPEERLPASSSQSRVRLPTNRLTFVSFPLPHLTSDLSGLAF